MTKPTPDPRHTLTLRDVSEASGVSEMTVSRVLRNRGDVSAPTREKVLEAARAFKKIGFQILASEGTHRFLKENGIEAEKILKMHEGRPNIVDAIKNGEIQLVINTPSGRLSKYDDSYIRKAAIKYKIPYITTIAAAVAAVKGIAALKQGHGRAKSLQSYHAEIQ